LQCPLLLLFLLLLLLPLLLLLLLLLSALLLPQLSQPFVVCDTCSAGEHLLTVLKERRLRQLQREGLVRRRCYTALAAVTCDCIRCDMRP